MLEHKVFISVGHDEYWSGSQRANVEAARDAGVNLAFFSGNEIFWKTRWEDSIDGSATDHRTLVCYKETHANEPIDPEDRVPGPGTWRDPRFSPPADGGRPENALSGTIFSRQRRHRRRSRCRPPTASCGSGATPSIATLTPGETATLGRRHARLRVGRGPDNGFRPAGLIDLSSTTAEVPQLLDDYGSNYGPGTATHHLTLYRAPSGALVFGAGTVQWSWGLDGEHDRGTTAPDPRMQQATVNLLADMGVQPGTLQARPCRRDANRPTRRRRRRRSPARRRRRGRERDPGHDQRHRHRPAGETRAVRSAASRSRSTAAKPGTRRPGREDWTYTWTPAATGSTTILARAVDDSGNLEIPGARSASTSSARPARARSGTTPSAARRTPTRAGRTRRQVPRRRRRLHHRLRFYKTSGNTGTHVGHLWTAAGTELAQVTFTGRAGSGWQQASFDNPVAIEADTTYVASYHAPNGHYAVDRGLLRARGVDNPPLHALADGVDGPNGIYHYGASGELFSGRWSRHLRRRTTWSTSSSTTSVGPDTTPPTVNARSPVRRRQRRVDRNATSAATFNEAMDPSTINSGTVELRDAASR